MASLEKEHEGRRESAFAEFKKSSEVHDVTLVRTPAGLGLTPIKNGDVLDPAEFLKMPPEEQARIRAAMERLGEDARLESLPAWEHEHHEKSRPAQPDHRPIDGRPPGRGAARPLGQPPARGFRVLRPGAKRHRGERARAGRPAKRPGWGRRCRRCCGDCSRWPSPSSATRSTCSWITPVKGAPVVIEDRPTFANLVGRIEYVAQLGALVTDFSLIQAGALHRANGGYLVLEARRGAHPAVRLGGAQAGPAVERDPHRVDRPDVGAGQHGLARARTDAARREGRCSSAIASSTTCSPSSTPSSSSCSRSPPISRRRSTRARRATRVCPALGSLARKAASAPTAAPSPGSSSTRREWRATRSRLSTHMRGLGDLLREADYFAGTPAERTAVAAEDVQQAIDGAEPAGRPPAGAGPRADRAGMRPHRDRRRERRPGQRAVGARAGRRSFGHPARITATARRRPGRGDRHRARGRARRAASTPRAC